MNTDQVGQQPILEIRVVREVLSDMAAQLMLATFYGFEMERSMGWSTEQRFGHLRQAQIMIASGESRMYIATIKSGLPVAMLVTTKTSNPKIRRLDSLLVIETYRRQGIARRLFDEARRGGADFHSFATPSATNWHLANGFRSLGLRPEGTFEMFTGDYEPEYKFAIAMPELSDIDRKAIQDLSHMESNLKTR